MSCPNKHQLSLLCSAVGYLEEKEYGKYFRLKGLLAERSKGYKKEFSRIFINFYRLNAARTTSKFRNQYFKLLFGLDIKDAPEPHAVMLKKLYKIKGSNGRQALQCSFVSKLVAIHDETYPIYDKHVGCFFGISVPSYGDVDFRITGFLTNLMWLRETYHKWSRNTQFQAIVTKMKKKHPSLSQCSDSRLADFLVWTVGRKELWRLGKKTKKKGLIRE